MTGPKYLCARLLCVPGLDQVRPSRGLRLEQCDRHLCLLPSVAIARRVEPPAALVRQQPAKELTREQRRVLLPGGARSDAVAAGAKKRLVSID